MLEETLGQIKLVTTSLNNEEEASSLEIEESKQEDEII